MYDFIDVNRYAEISDLCIKEHRDAPKLHDLKNGSIIFCQDANAATSFLFPELKKTNKEFVLITVRDIEVSEQKTDLMPSNIIAWFGNNVTSCHEKVFGVPIGLPPLNVQFNRFDGVDGIAKRHILSDLIPKKPLYTPSKLAYIAHSNHTNPRRHVVNSIFKDKEWVTQSQSGARINYNSYIIGIKNHKYTISPEGAGIDCHRTWECLYLGNTPIVEKSRAMSFFSDLPIIQIDRFENLTETKLKSYTFPRMVCADGYSIKDAKSTEMLNFSFWESLINEVGTAK